MERWARLQEEAKIQVFVAVYECKLACPIYSWKGFGCLSSITALTLPQTVLTIEGKNPPNSPLGFFFFSAKWLKIHTQ